MKHSIISLLIVLFICSTVHAQINVGSNTAPDSSAMLQISGTAKGFLPPRMSRDSMYLIAKPAKGLLVFNTTDSLLFMRRDSGWVALAAGDQVWQKNGNAIYNNNSGFVGIGTTSPSTLLHVEGANPLTLLGVADGTTTITDSVLTITNGLVKKIPLSSLAMVSNGISSATAPLVYSGGVISINQASTTDDGYLSSSDYNIFNDKVSSIALNGGTVYTTSSFGINGGAATGTLTLNNQIKNSVFAGPTSGANAKPTFRALGPADLPVATTTATTGLGVISVGNGLSVTPGGVLSVTNPGGGSVTSASVVTANGLAGTVVNPTTTPAITLTTTVTGMVKGNGTALSAAISGTDYAPGTASNTTGIVKSTTGTGALTTATASDFPTLNQNTTGTAANITGVLNATSLPALTGDVTSTAGSATTTISNGAVSNAKMANMATQTFKGRTTAGTGSPEDLTATQATAMLNTFNTAKGLVPGVASNTTSFLRADGTFAVPPGTNTNAGTVTSVSVTSANGVSGTVVTNTTTPAISLTLGDITPTSVAATGTVTGSNLSGSHSGISSGTNTGDETNATIKSKLGPATSTTDGYLTLTDWNTFNNKASTANVISSLNGLTATSQTFATPGTTGTAPAWSSAGSIHTLNIPLASATGVTAGLLSNADWNTFNNKATATGTWSTTGNSGTNIATNFLGTTDFKSLRFRTNNIQRMIADSIGNVAIGTDTFDATNPEKFLINAGNTSSVNGLVAKGTINNYFQMNIKNLSSGGNATSDIVATADNGSETTNYVDIGINGSGYTGSAIQTGAANDGYLISSGNDFYLVNSGANKNMLFLTGGTGVANERMRILANGYVGMGVQNPTAEFVVKDTMEIRRTGSLSQLLFTNTAGTGDFRIGGDGGDIFWQGGGSRNLQMGSYWTTVLGGDRQGNGGSYPAFVNGTGGTGVLVQSQRDVSVPLAIQSYSATQSGNLTEWRNSSGTVLSAVTKDGNFGIGLSNPSTKLHIVGTNPLTLNGVQTGTNTSSDSLLTITNGLVRKLPLSTFGSSANAWATVGNSGTTSGTNFLGTTDNASFKFRTNNTQAMLLDSLGNAAIGSAPAQTSGNIEKLLVDAGNTNSFNVISGKGSINNYLQLNIQNKNAGTNASSDVVATADNGDESNNFVDLGINSSVNNTNYFGGANDAYLYAQSQNMLIGTATANKSIAFLTGGGTQSTNERMRINGSGNVGIGTNNPLTALHVSAASNPLTLNGVQTGANTDSILTIINGTVKKLSPSALAIPSSNAWSLVGNSNTLSNNYFLGTTNSDPLIIKVNNQPTGRLDAVNTYLGYQSGYNNGTNANQSTGIGYHALFSNTSGTYNTAIGYGALQNNASGSNNIGVGNNAAVINNSSNSIAIGTNSNINNSNSIAIGNTAQTNNTNAISIGNNTYTNGNYGIAIGSGPGNPKTQAYADYSMAFGYNAYAGGTNAISIGQATNSTQPNSISIGNASSATGANSVAIGYNAAAASDNTIVLGDKSNAAVSVAIGSENFSASPNREKLLVDATTIGSFNVISARGNLNNYLQLNVQNKNAGGNASSDLVATTDNGDENNNFVDLGINSSGNTSNLWGGAGDAYLYTQTNNMLIGTAGNSKVLSFLTGGGTQSSNERMRIDGNGNVGIGTTSPSTKLHIVGTNPLTLTGVQTGTNTSADSLLTITSGLVRKLPLSTFAPSTAWSLTGNGGTNSSANFLGTTDAQPLLFKVNNQQIGRLELNSFAFGAGAGVNTATNSMALGYGATLGSGVTNAMALGSAANAGISNTFVIGNSAASSNAGNSFAIGNSATVASTNSFVIGSSASTAASITDAFAIGSSAIVNGSNSLAIGKSASTGTGATSAVAIGNGVQANATGSVSIGAAATAVGTGSTNSIAIGTGASIGSSLTNSTAIGANASTTFSNTMILGDRSNQSLSVGIGSEAFSPSTREKLLVDAGTVTSDGYISVIGAKGSTNNYMQVNLQNRSNGSIASTDMVATNDAGTELNQTGFVDMGINSSGNTSTGVLGGNSTAYLYSTGNDFSIGNNTSTKSLNFFTTDAGGSAERMRISGSGNVGIGTTSPADKFSVVNSAGALTSSFTSTQAADRTIVSATNSTGGSVGLRAHGSSYSETLLGNSMTGASSLLAINAGNGLFAMGTFNTGDVVLGTSNNERIRITANGYVGIGTNAPTAFMQLRAGNASAGNAPLKLTSGTSLTTPENGAVEYDGTNYYVTSGSTRYTMAKTLTAIPQALDFPSTPAASASTLTITVTGAADGDVVVLGTPSSAALVNGVFSAYVSAANTVTVKFSNSTAGAVDPASGTFRVSILKY